MTQAELIQSTFSLPGGKGKYLDTLVEFLTWVAPRAETTRQDALGWFAERFNAAKSAQYYLPVLRDIGVIESDRGKTGAIRLTETGRVILEADLEEQTRIVAERFVSQFVANREVLRLFASSDRPVPLREVHERLAPQFSSWTTPTQFDYRLSWFDSLGLLRCVSGRTFEITQFGREYSERFPPDEPHTQPVPSPVRGMKVDGEPIKPRPHLIATPNHDLFAELHAASTDSSNSDRFEMALARAFERLGFSVTQLGKAGNTDVLIKAPAGSETYLAVVDAKARGTGKVDQLEPLHLKDHQSLNDADYAVVVAGGFAGGKVASHAQEQGITLLPLPVLEEWLKLHDAWPQDLMAYRSIFAIKGLVEKLPAELLRVTSDRKRWGKLLADVVDLFGETYGHGLGDPLSARDVFKMLVTRKRGVDYPEKDVAGVLELLNHPVVGALARKDGGYILVMSRETLALRLRRLAEEVEVMDDQESV